MARISAPIGAAEVHQREHVLPVVLEVARVAAEEERGEDVVDDRGDGAGEVVGLAEAGEAGVGVDADPEVVGEGLAGGGVASSPTRPAGGPRTRSSRSW